LVVESFVARPRRGRGYGTVSQRSHRSASQWFPSPWNKAVPRPTTIRAQSPICTSSSIAVSTQGSPWLSLRSRAPDLSDAPSRSAPAESVASATALSEGSSHSAGAGASLRCSKPSHAPVGPQQRVVESALLPSPLDAVAVVRRDPPVVVATRRSGSVAAPLSRLGARYRARASLKALTHHDPAHAEREGSQFPPLGSSWNSNRQPALVHQQTDAHRPRPLSSVAPMLQVHHDVALPRPSCPASTQTVELPSCNSPAAPQRLARSCATLGRGGSPSMLPRAHRAQPPRSPAFRHGASCSLPA
jgi:hypothetical protein